MNFNKVAIIGVGLMGGSLARVMKKRGIAQKISGAGRSSANLKTALELGIIDEIKDAEGSVKDADLVILCTPVLSIIPTLKTIAPHLKKGAIVTDVGSSKEQVVRSAGEVDGDFVFIGSHPIAGTEKKGAAASFDTLYEGHRCIITPSDKTDAGVIETMKDFWKAIGMKPVVMNPATHDRILAAVSHLPHVMVYALVNSVCDANEENELIEFAAGGFKDFTRIASSPPEMWADIFLDNSGNVTGLIKNVKKELDKIEEAITKGDRESLMKIFRKSNSFRNLLK